MKIRELLNDWIEHSPNDKATIKLHANLPLTQVARIQALAELFPGRTQDQIITELLEVALDGLEEAMPYVQGSKVITEDELGDPVYEDVGLTPQFLALTKKYLQQLRAKHESIF